MHLRNLGLYLIGNRQAILNLAADRRCLWVGLLFVLSAGLAREYDGQDLLREPWHLLVPFAASLAASFLLFLISCGSLFLHKEGRPPFFGAYRAFLTLFWMTAPLAWLYAIPYERFLSPADATRANLLTLALVAAWRVALMVRVVSVISRRTVTSSLLLVMAFADAAALAAVVMIPQPVVAIMGGVRLTESEQVIHGATFLVSCLGVISAPVWLIGGAVAFATNRPVWQVPDSSKHEPSLNIGSWILAALSLAIWLPILPWTQAEQRLRTQVEADLKAGRIADALDLMSAHAAPDFPPQWDPPPRVGYGETTPHIFQVMEVVLARNSAPWVRAIYEDKFRQQMSDRWAFNWYSGDELAALVRILNRLPDGPDIASTNRNTIQSRASNSSPASADRENLEALLKLARNGTAQDR
jgi:hypothetical protein